MRPLLPAFVLVLTLVGPATATSAPPRPSGGHLSVVTPSTKMSRLEARSPATSASGVGGSGGDDGSGKSFRSQGFQPGHKKLGGRKAGTPNKSREGKTGPGPGRPPNPNSERQIRLQAQSDKQAAREAKAAATEAALQADIASVASRIGVQTQTSPGVQSQQSQQSHPFSQQYSHPQPSLHQPHFTVGSPVMPSPGTLQAVNSFLPTLPALPSVPGSRSPSSPAPPPRT